MCSKVVVMIFGNNEDIRPKTVQSRFYQLSCNIVNIFTAIRQILVGCLVHSGTE